MHSFGTWLQGIATGSWLRGLATGQGQALPVHFLGDGGGLMAMGEAS